MKTLCIGGATLAALTFFSTTVWAQVTPAPAQMPAFAQFTAQKQGKIKGEVLQKGREEQMQLWGFEWEIVSPRDPASGAATGRVQHKGVRLLRKVGAGSVQLFQALVTNENFTVVQLSFFGAPSKGSGAEAMLQSITLNNASLASYRQFEQPGVGLMEELVLTYQKLTITNPETGVSSATESSSRV
ncbi:type VI secretion system tube protein Hcp [Armatimonas rosea]|uniref:Type VI secretion system secreted protein Hcp n=1 Tax=Armatimonas rosea TaxID=685828 RepID=A0A7W9SN00_ARMRO|nr:type VI secretion system tube protein Hcp [Armatimonas rosea]MBB6048839.1 type VI secretion system secreted protein Hcp [Armatimonas rosea]